MKRSKLIIIITIIVVVIIAWGVLLFSAYNWMKESNTASFDQDNLQNIEPEEHEKEVITLKDSYCGDGLCAINENCNSCVEDCGCSEEEYCSDIGICRVPTCGDNICSEEESSAVSCCEDCGCSGQMICNKVLHQCQEPLQITDEAVEDIAENYIIDNNVDGSFLGFTDTYYGDSAIKQLTIDCQQEGSEYPCLIIMYVDEDGKIIEELHTT